MNDENTKGIRNDRGELNFDVGFQFLHFYLVEVLHFELVNFFIKYEGRIFDL